jgi:hypothetical protein
MNRKWFFALGIFFGWFIGLSVGFFRWGKLSSDLSGSLVSCRLSQAYILDKVTSEVIGVDDQFKSIWPKEKK